MQSHFEEIYQLAKKGDEASINRLKELKQNGIDIDEEETPLSLLSPAAKLAKENVLPAVSILHSLGAKKGNIAYGFGLGWVHWEHWPRGISIDDNTALWAATGAVTAGHIAYAEELRVKFSLDVFVIAEMAIKNGHLDYANHLLHKISNHKAIADKIIPAAVRRQVSIRVSAAGKSLSEKDTKELKYLSQFISVMGSRVAQELSSQLAPPSPAIVKAAANPPAQSAGVPRNNTTNLQTTSGLFAVKLEELVGKVSPAMVVDAYNHLVNPINVRKIPVPTTIIAPHDSILTKFMRFKSDDILYTFFQQELISQLTHHEQALLKKCRFVIHGSKKADGTISPVYYYSHELGTRGKPELELTLTQLYMLFNFLISYHVRTVENNDLPEGYLNGVSILQGISDFNPEISSLRVEFIPPQKHISIFEIFSVFEKIAQLQFNWTACQKEDGTLPFTHLPQLNSEQLNKLRFSNFFSLVQQSLNKCYERFMDALVDVTIKDVPNGPCPLELLPNDKKTQIIEMINATLRALKIDASIVSDMLLLPENDQQKSLLVALLRHIEHSLAIENNNEVAGKGQKPIYDKATGKGDIVENNMLFYLRLKYSEQSVGDLLDSPEIRLLTDNIAYQPTNNGSLVIYSETSPYKNIGACTLQSFYGREIFCQENVLVALETVLSNALSKQKLKLEIEQKKNTYRQKYQQLSNQELLSAYNQMGGVFFIRKLRLTEDNDGTNPLNAFLQRYNGENILPAALIKRGLIASTYPGIWQSCAGLVVIPGDEQEQLVTAYKRPANSNLLKGIQICQEKIGSALQSMGGKPYSAINPFVDKLHSNQEKAMFNVEDRDSFDYIKSFMTFCTHNNKKELVTGKLNQKIWDEIHGAFKEFLANYFHMMYGVPAQEAANHKIYQQMLQKFQKKFMYRNATSFASLYKDIVREKSDKPNKTKYGNQSRFHSEVLLKINMHKRSLYLGDTEMDVLRELLIERCGEAVAAFVQLDVVSSITDALTIGEALKAYHGEGYVPIYAVLDERNLLDPSGMEVAVEKTGTLTFKTEEELLTMLTQAPISRDVDSIRQEIRARITIPEKLSGTRAAQPIVAAMPVAGAPSSVMATPSFPLKSNSNLVVMSPFQPSRLLPVVSGSVWLSALFEYEPNELQVIRGDIQDLIIDKYPVDILRSNESIDAKVDAILQKWSTANIRFDMHQCKYYIDHMHALPKFLSALQKRRIFLDFTKKPFLNFEFKNLSLLGSCEKITFHSTVPFSIHPNGFSKLLTALPQNIHCEMPSDFIEGCKGTNFSMITLLPRSGSSESNVSITEYSLAKLKVSTLYLHKEDFLSLPVNVFSRPQTHFLLDASGAEDKCSQLMSKLHPQHHIAALFFRQGLGSSLKDLISALDKMSVKPTIIFKLLATDLEFFYQLTGLEVDIFKRLVSQGCILFLDSPEILKNNLKQIASSPLSFLAVLLINSSYNEDNHNYQNLVDRFNLRQQAPRQVNNPPFVFFQQPAVTVPAATSSTPSTTVSMTQTPGASSSKKRAQEDDTDSSKPDVTPAQRKRMG